MHCHPHLHTHINGPDLHISGTRLSLDTIKRRLQTINRFNKDEKDENEKAPLFRADITLALPTVVMRPALEEIQSNLNKAVQVMHKRISNELLQVNLHMSHLCII